MGQYSVVIGFAVFLHRYRMAKYREMKADLRGDQESILGSKSASKGSSRNTDIERVSKGHST